MTVLDDRGARGTVTGVPLRYLVGTLLVLLGMIVGIGVGRWIETGSREAGVTYVGPSVERSLAMERSHDVLEGWGRAQAAALGSVTASGPYVGPSVERSLAMEGSHDVLEGWGRVHAKLLASENG